MSHAKATTDAAIGAAATNLGSVWLHQKDFHVAQLGFGFILKPDAPNDHRGLTRAWEHSCSTGDPLPISSLHNEQSIYDAPDLNASFRWVHDVLHMLSGLTFCVMDEIELATIHLEVIRGFGFRPDSLEHQIAHADLIGQIIALQVNGRYPTDQRTFVVNCLRLGMDSAVELEAAARGLELA